MHRGKPPLGFAKAEKLSQMRILMKNRKGQENCVVVD